MKDAAKIYGEALYELARSEELDGQLLPQLRGAAELLTGAPEYQYILSSPAISKAERTGLLDQAFSGSFFPLSLPGSLPSPVSSSPSLPSASSKSSTCMSSSFSLYETILEVAWLPMKSVI